MKKSTIYYRIGLAILMVGFLMTVSSCSKKEPRLDPMEPYPSGTEMGTAADQQMDADQPLTEEELQAQRIKEQEAARMAEQKAARMKEEARMQFTDEDVHFNFDDASLSPEARAILQQKVAWMRENPGTSVLIEGHCDERGTAEYNIALGQRRAQSVKTFMVNAGINPSRLSTISYGEERPIDFGNNESAWAKNRRAHFKIQN